MYSKCMRMCKVLLVIYRDVPRVYCIDTAITCVHIHVLLVGIVCIMNIIVHFLTIQVIALTSPLYLTSTQLLEQLNYFSGTYPFH